MPRNEYVSKKRMIEGVALFCNDFEQQGYEVRSGSRLDRRIMYCDFSAQLKALDQLLIHQTCFLACGRATSSHK